MKLGSMKREERSASPKYYTNARALLKTAQDLSDLADSRYGNGLAIIAIHAAIAYTDALTTAYRDVKSTSGDHRDAADVLVHALGTRVEHDRVRQLKNILDAKTHASYSGAYYTLEQGRRLLKDTQAFAEWAEGMYHDRPVAQ